MLGRTPAQEDVRVRVSGLMLGLALGLIPANGEHYVYIANCTFPECKKSTNIIQGIRRSSLRN